MLADSFEDVEILDTCCRAKTDPTNRQFSHQSVKGSRNSKQDG